MVNIEFIVLAVFALLLFLCLIFDISILFALVAGLLLFVAYSIKRGFKLREVIGFALSGVKTVKNILITFVLIGILTALWREAGTIPVIVCYASELIKGPIFLLMTFLLNAFISVLTGTAFGTAATIGVICGTIGASLGIPSVLTGGAVLSGVYFGDRCSPISTSALLVATLTKTDIFANIKKMIRTSIVPFILTCALYAVVGAFCGSEGATPDFSAVFNREFDLSLVAVIPAVLLLLLAVFKVNVKLAMAASICAAIPICIWVQGSPILSLPSVMLLGYAADDPEIASMLNGGGIVSMVKVAVIVCISSAYSGIFQKTGLLDRIKGAILRLSERTSPYLAAILTSIITGMVSCNQTLTIMLTEQLCNDVCPDDRRLAILLEDTAVVISALIPWSIACAVPLTSVGAPLSSVAFASFLYLLPACGLLSEIMLRKKKAK